MPKHSPDYSRAFIYALKAPGSPEVYYGSCTTSPELRWAQHVNHFNRWCAGMDEQRYLRAFDVMVNQGAEMTVLEEFPCDSAEELHKREREWIEKDSNSVNCCIPGRSRKEYEKLPAVQERNRIRAKQAYHAGYSEKKKAYYAENREKILSKAKALREAGKAALSQN